MVDDVVAIDRGVQDRELLQRGHGGLDEEAHEAQTHAVRLLELVAVLLAQRHDRRHVHFVERGQDGVFVLRLQQALGDAGAQTGHRYALFRTVADGGDHGRRSGSSSLGLGGDGVFFGHATTTARTGDVARGDALLVEDLARSRAGSAGGTRSGGGRRGSRSGRSGGGRSSTRGGLGFGVDLGDQLARGHGVTTLLDDLDQHAIGRRRRLEHDLVGLDVDQVLVARHGVAFLLVPGDQRRFGHGLGQLRYFDFDQHEYLSLVVISSGTAGWCPGSDRRHSR